MFLLFKVKAALAKGEDVNSRDEENKTTLLVIPSLLAILTSDIRRYQNYITNLDQLEIIDIFLMQNTRKIKRLF